ncbi:hypothetical protein [Arthrobacter sp. CP30]
MHNDDEPQPIFGGTLAYWWATQNDNYPLAIAEGSLWTCPRSAGRELGAGRRAIFDLQPGDLVFHHQQSYLRAVSRVTAPFRDFPRTAAYGARENEGDMGWRVDVEPLHTNLALHFSEVARLIDVGSPGPFGIDGRPQQKFLSPLSEQDGTLLLAALKIKAPLPQGLLGRPIDSWAGKGTDEVSLGVIRKEQSALRQHLLVGASSARCAVCGEDFPANLLIAGHIKPRSLCSEAERVDFTSAAMLICNLGCDALFEWGYVIVDPTGILRRGKQAETESVRDRVDLLVGKQCSAFNNLTAPRFRAHAELRVGSVEIQ